MPGTKSGAVKAKATILAKNPNHFREIGRIGGSRLTGPERARIVGSRGGKISRKNAAKLKKANEVTILEEVRKRKSFIHHLFGMND